jgi:Holliday junction resolvase RusA-like endonuclease
MRLEVTIPGPPVAQGRGKVGKWRSKDGREGVTVRDPTKSRNWKATAQEYMLAVRRENWSEAPIHYPADRPLALMIEVVFLCPPSQHRKKWPIPRRRACGSRNDADNLAKAVMDAGNGVLWLDDGQIAVLHVEKWVGAQGEAPYVRLVVEDLQ